LPRGFVDVWDGWMQQVLAASRTTLGEDWLAAWLEAPVWRFALSPNLCGPDAVVGLWMPSVDRVGRHYPLTIAAVLPGGDPSMMMRDGSGFLDAAERAGIAAVEADLAPEVLAADLSAAFAEAPAAPDAELSPCPSGGALWWSAGAPRLPPTTFSCAGLPDTATFAAMLDASRGVRP
jgi:type VI secretion system protein ImpM